jgi:L-ascorbate metabolism protein UlaG (beta-lactamase superfamily)
MLRLALALLLLAPAAGLAQDAPPACTLRWLGHSFFQLETPAGKKVVFDPQAVPAFNGAPVAADIVLISHEHSDHTQLQMVRDIKSARVFHGIKLVNRRYEWNPIDEQVGKVHVRDVGLYHDNQEGFSRGKNAAFIVEVGGLTFCHLGDIGHVPTDAQVKAIGPIDVLMVPVGGVYTLNGDGAKKAVAKLKPRLYVLPMHYGVPGFDDLLPPDEFLDGNTLAVKKTPATNELVIPLDAKADAPTVVLLGWKAQK